MAEIADTGEMANLLARLDALRASGVAERDPIRFAYLAALLRRAAAQPEPVRQSLAARIGAAADELAARPVTPPTGMAKACVISPLAELLAYIGQHADASPESAQAAMTNISSGRHSSNTSAGRARQAQELKSVAIFRNEWSKLSTEQHLTQTLAQAPENAGPMNSQHLVLRSLQLMHDIAPDYLQGFMSYVDTLIWLEHADPTKQTTGRSSTGEGEKKARTSKRGPTRRPSNAG